MDAWMLVHQLVYKLGVLSAGASPLMRCPDDEDVIQTGWRIHAALVRS